MGNISHPQKMKPSYIWGWMDHLFLSLVGIHKHSLKMKRSFNWDEWITYSSVLKGYMSHSLKMKPSYSSFQKGYMNIHLR